MPVSRREFLERSAVLAASAAIPQRRLTRSEEGSPAAEGSSGPKGTAQIKGKGAQATVAAPGLANMNMANFNNCLGQQFAVQSVNGIVWLRLMTVRDLTGTNADPSNPGAQRHLGGEDSGLLSAPAPSPSKCFSLQFIGGDPGALSQNTYTFQQDLLGQFDLFIVPSGPAATVYTAIINRI